VSAENIDELLEQLEPSPLVHFLARLVGRTSFADGWQERARCKDRPSWWFFPWKERLSDPWIRKARWECARCPVRRECLEATIRFDTIGVWGGNNAKRTPRREPPARVPSGGDAQPRLQGDRHLGTVEGSDPERVEPILVPLRVVTLKNATDLIDTLKVRDGDRVVIRIEGIARVADPVRRTSGEWSVEVTVDVDHGETREILR
jgi:hypothetical protein